jgi:hypothetical protein
MVSAWVSRNDNGAHFDLGRGAGERIRTADLLITNQLLYQLSYAGSRVKRLLS